MDVANAAGVVHYKRYRQYLIVDTVLEKLLTPTNFGYVARADWAMWIDEF